MGLGWVWREVGDGPTAVSSARSGSRGGTPKIELGLLRASYQLARIRWHGVGRAALGPPTSSCTATIAPHFRPWLPTCPSRSPLAPPFVVRNPTLSRRAQLGLELDDPSEVTDHTRTSCRVASSLWIERLHAPLAPSTSFRASHSIVRSCHDLVPRTGSAARLPAGAPMPVRAAAESPPSHYPRKPTPTTGIDGNRMDAASYLTQVQSRASVRTRSLSNGSSSLISYASTLPQFDLQGRKRSSSDSAGSDDSNESTRSLSWRGLNTSMPLSSAVSATRPVTRAFDVDFVPNPQDPYSLRHSEYGYDTDPAHRTISQYTPGDDLSASEEEPSVLVYLFTYVSYALLILIGHLRDFIGKRLFPREYAHLKPSNGYAPLYSDFDSFYTRRLKLRIEDCFARPITGVAARTATILDRTPSKFFHDFTFTGETTQALNISSYNYLGFAQTRGPCADQAEEMVKTLGVTAAGGRNDVGTSDFHVQAERLVAAFLGTEDAMIVSMGFATNSTSLPALLTKGCLVISDELNHSSIRFGARLSGAMVRQYKHNNMKDLEQLLRECVSQGQPRTHRPWKKIMVIVEGLYSMEGTLVDLPVILQLKEKYKFYLYIDEAHSIGALGPRGRGVCDYFGVDPKRIDILMGTFTKSFGASGGYIAGSHALINALRLTSHSQNYAEAMAPPVLSQIVTSMGSIMGPAALAYVPALAKLPTHLMDGREGQDRLRRLAFNCRYLSGGLKKLGFIVYGHRDSPIVPLLLFSPGKMGSFSRMMLERHKIVVVVVAYPATPLVASRVRFCLSSAHTKEDLDRILRATDEIGGILGLKLSPKGPRMDVEDVIRTGVQMVRDSELEPYRP